MTTDDDLPVSVRLGEVVPPEDPEDWTRPLTWAVALGLVAPAVLAAGWLWLAPPSSPPELTAVALGVAAAVGGGAGLAGATQRGWMRAGAGTLVAALFGSLATVIVTAGAGAGARDHVLLGILGGAIGAAGAALVLAALRRVGTGGALWVGALTGAAAGAAVTWMLLGAS